MRKRSVAFLSLAFFGALLLWRPESASACGGFFCQNTPVDQNAERIIFTENGDGTISAYIQIQYTGDAPDFSWILPLPSAIGAEDIEVPEDAMAAFFELEVATDPVFIPPPLPQCVVDNLPLFAMSESADGRVTVFATGAVGPFAFDVIGSENPDAVIEWLRDNGYRVTPEMEPLIDVYVSENFAFLAMQLLPDKEAQDVEPVKITYRSELPMIPLRLTAVAANSDMAVMVWVFADQQAYPANYAKLEIPDSDIVFTPFGGTNYRQLLGEQADEYGGQGFITEFAAPSRELSVVHPLLQELRLGFPYVTRLNTVISPEEMTVDPVFDYDPQLRDVSNVHDLSNMRGVFDCERATLTLPVIGEVELPQLGGASSDPSTENSESTGNSELALVGAGLFGAVIVVSVGMFVTGVILTRRAKK